MISLLIKIAEKSRMFSLCESILRNASSVIFAMFAADQKVICAGMIAIFKQGR